MIFSQLFIKKRKSPFRDNEFVCTFAARKLKEKQNEQETLSFDG